MKHSLIPFILILLLGSSIGVVAQKKTAPDIRTKSKEQLIQDFISKDWGRKVEPAKFELESMQAIVLDDIIRLLDSDQKVKLKDTGSLIYPGAEEFYGQGGILDYDVDWISVRAGWLLEVLTFQDFGFREGVINEADIMKAVMDQMKGKSGNYLQDVRAKLKDEDARKKARIVAVEKAKNWWKDIKKPWTRLDGLLDALRSNNLARQNEAVHWLRFGDTKLDGLTESVYKDRVLPEIQRLKKSDDKGLRDQIDLLLKDGWSPPDTRYK